MKLFKFTNRNHLAADTWRVTLQTKEDNKVVDKNVTPSSVLSPITNLIQAKSVQHVICTAETLKKSAEEKLQIQKVHDELEQVRIIPQFAI